MRATGRALRTVLALCCAMGWGAFAAIPNNPNDPVLAADSDFVNAVYARPASNLHDVLIARETAAVAADKVAHERLDAYLEGVALARLAGEDPPPVGTIREIVEGKTPSVERSPLRSRILETTLRPKLVHSADGHALFPEKDPSMFLRYRYEGRSVWSSYHSTSGAPYWVYLRIEIENVGAHVVSQFDSRLHLRLSDGKTVTLDCRAKPWFEQGLRTGMTAPHVCASDVRYISAQQLVEAVRAAESDPGAWKLEPSRINFVEPPISLNSRGTFWLNASMARQEVVSKVRGASCSERNSCLDDVRFRMKYNPAWGFGVQGLVTGIVLGVALRFFGRFRWRAARIASGLSIAGFVLVLAGVASRGGMSILAALLAGTYGVFGLIAFNGAMWSVLGLLSLWPRVSSGRSA